MSVPETKRKELRRHGSGRAAVSPDVGETRAVLLAAVALGLFLYLLQFILLPFVLAGVIAYVCTPVLDWLAERTRLPRLLFAILLFLILLSAAAVTLTVTAQYLAAEATGTATELQGALESLARQASGSDSLHLFGQSLDAGEIMRAALERIRDWFGQTNQLAMMTGYSLAVLMGTVLTTVLLFYFLASGRSVMHGLFLIVPPNRRDLASRIGARLDPVLKRYFIGMIALVIYATIASYIGLGLVLGIDHAVLLALLTGILEIIPVFGTTSAAVIAGLVSLHTATGFMSILAYAAYAVVLRLTIDQIVGPVVLGRAARVHPVLIIFCFLSGAILLGILGVILAVPVALVAKSTLAALYDEDDE